MEKTVNSIASPDFNKNKKVDFYKLFFKQAIIDKVVQHIAKNYIVDGNFDEETGEALESRPMTQDEILVDFRSRIILKIVNDVNLKIEFIEGIPVASIPTNDVREEYKDAGAAVIRGHGKAYGIMLIKDSMAEDIEKDLYHEIVHLAVSALGIGSLKHVNPELDSSGLIKNDVECERYNYAHDFIDECLAYGMNAYAVRHNIDADMINNYFFYRNLSKSPVGYDFDQNCKILADLLNQTIKDRTGKIQYKFYYYLIKYVNSLDDLDFTKQEVKDKFTRLTNIQIS